MLGASEREQMRRNRATLIGERPTPIRLRRGGVELAEQMVRVVQAGTGTRAFQSVAGEAGRRTVIVYGHLDLDIQVGDRFNDAEGQLYEVTFLRPGLLIGVVAEAQAVQ